MRQYMMIFDRTNSQVGFVMGNGTYHSNSQENSAVSTASLIIIIIMILVVLITIVCTVVCICCLRICRPKPEVEKPPTLVS